MVLSFGIRSASKLFMAVADAAEWIVREASVKYVIHYLDDFLVVGLPDSGECEWAMRTGESMRDISGTQGLPEALIKTLGWWRSSVYI